MTVASEYQKEISKLRQENDFLKAELAYLKHGPDKALVRFRDTYGLEPVQARISVALSDGALHSASSLMARCGFVRDADPGAVRVHVYRINKKIKPHRIMNVKGEGYYLKGTALARIRAIVKGNSDV